LKQKLKFVAFLTVVLALSAAATGLENSLTVHVRIPGEEDDILTIHLEKISEDFFIRAKIKDEDLAQFQYYFAIARAVEYVDMRIVEGGPGYYIITIAKEALHQIGPDEYVMTLPDTALKTDIDTAVYSQYEEAVKLVVTVYADNKYLRTFVASMGVDIASVNLNEGYMTVFASYEELLALNLAGFNVVVVADLIEYIETLELEPEYHTYPEVVSELTQIETDHPSIAEVFSLGTSFEGRDIPGIKISDNVGTEESEPEVLIFALHHAREAATVEVAMYIINQLTDNYGTNDDVTFLVDNREIYIIPVVNPDGKVYDDSGGAFGEGQYWRKSRQPCSGGTGTDLNRNYGYQWGGSGSSGACVSETFRGNNPFDAPETAAVKDFVEGHPDITMLLSYHSYSRLVLWPWGYTTDSIGDHLDRRVHEEIGTEYASYTGYTPKQASDLYVASGITDDWSYGTTQNNTTPLFSWTVELEPDEFYPPSSDLPLICERNCEAALQIMMYADNPYTVLPVRITNPRKEGQNVSGTVSVTVETQSDIHTVGFYIDGVLKHTDTTSPFSWDWDTTGDSNGSHIIKATGSDNNQSYDDSVSVEVFNEEGGCCGGTFVVGVSLLMCAVVCSQSSVRKRT